MITVLGQGTAVEALWPLCHGGFCTQTVLACGCRVRMEGMFAVTCARFSRPWHADVHFGMLVSMLGCRYCTRIWIPLAGCSCKAVYKDVGREYTCLYWDAVLEMEYKFPFQDADPVLGCRDHTRIQLPYQDVISVLGPGEEDGGTHTRVHRAALGCRYWTRMWAPLLGHRCQYWDVDTTLGCGHHARM